MPGGPKITPLMPRGSAIRWSAVMIAERHAGTSGTRGVQAGLREDRVEAVAEAPVGMRGPEPVGLPQRVAPFAQGGAVMGDLAAADLDGAFELVARKIACGDQRGALEVHRHGRRKFKRQLGLFRRG